MMAAKDGEYFWCIRCGIVRSKYKYDSSQYNKAYADTYLQYAKSPINQSLNLFRLGLISRWLFAKSKVLDIGCGVGEFIRFAENYYSCIGFEPNVDAADEAHSRTKQSTILTNLNGENYSFDCITMFDVIEHIEEPAEFLKHCCNILRPKGIIVITTPNVDAVMPCISSDKPGAPDRIKDDALRKWKHYKPKEHLLLYTESALEFLFGNIGMRVVHWGREESDIRDGNPNGDIMTCVARKDIR